MSVIKASAIRDDFLKKPPNGIPIVLISPSSRVLRKIKEAETYSGKIDLLVPGAGGVTGR